MTTGRESGAARWAWLAAVAVCSVAAFEIGRRTASRVSAPPIQQEPAERAAFEQLQAEVAQLRVQLEQARAVPDRTKTVAGAQESSAAAAQREAECARMRRRAELIREWREAALQTADPAARQAALEAIRRALGGDDPVAMQAALRALAGLRKLDYDKAAMRPLVRPLLEHGDAEVRAAALYALMNTEVRPEDGARLVALARDPAAEVRKSMSHILMMFHDGALDGAIDDVVFSLLDDADESVREGSLSGLWGARVGPRVEQRLLALSAAPETRHDAIYFGLSTLRDKSPAVVGVLVDALAAADPNVSERARWGLGHGVGKEAYAAAADGFVGLLETRASPHIVEECLERIATYGDRRHVTALQTYAARPLVDEATRTRIGRLIELLAARSW